MTTEDLNAVTKKLGDASVGETGLLSFKGKGLKLNAAEDAKEIIDAIDKCSSMNALSLEGNTLGVEAAEAIAKSLEKHSEFERALWSDMFTGRLKTEIPQALEFLGAAMIKAGAKLVELDLSDNAFGPNGVKGLVTLLKSKTCYTLRELRLNNNGLGTTGGKMLAECLMDCYKSSKAAGTPLALKVFVSGRGRLENEGSSALSEVFKLMGSLEEVCMPQNGINAEGISALAQAFEHNPNLRILNLNDNTFTEKGATSMAKILPKLQKLEVINFGDCLLRTEGAKVIANSISDGHTTLKELNLSGNEIGKAGAKTVIEALENKDNLETVDLDSNQIGEEGIEMLKESMETIGKLDMLGSLSGDEGSDEEDGDYDEDQEDDEAEDEQEGEKVEDPALQITGKALSPKQNVNVTDFISFPSPTKLHGFGKSLTSSVKEDLGAAINDVETVIHTLVRICSVVTEDDKKAQQSVCDCADTLLKDVFQNGNESTPSLVANAFLVYIGLLKGEDKKYRPPNDISGPLLVLNHVVKQSYFPRSASKIIAAFMDKPNPLLSNCMNIQSKLLQTLYNC